MWVDQTDLPGKAIGFGLNQSGQPRDRTGSRGSFRGDAHHVFCESITSR